MRRSRKPLPVLPQIPTSTEFGEGEYDVVMNMFVYAQAEIVLPPVSPRWSLRGANGGS